MIFLKNQEKHVVGETRDSKHLQFIGRISPIRIYIIRSPHVVVEDNNKHRDEDDGHKM